METGYLFSRFQMRCSATVHHENRPSTLIAIAGPSGSGKTSLARALSETWADQQAMVFSMDWYYHDLSSYSADDRARHNFDCPDALDKTLLLAQLKALAAGTPIHRPVYDFATNSRGEQTVLVSPRPVVIVEGLFVLYWPELRELCNLSVYVDCDLEECRRRRYLRDVEQRGIPLSFVEQQYQQTVLPMAYQYVLPTKKWADLSVDGQTPLSQNVALIRAQLEGGE